MNRQIKSKQIFAVLNTQLYISILLLTFFFTACKSSSDKTTKTNSQQVESDTITSAVLPNDSIDAVVKSIIDIAAKDFFKHQKPLPVAFRDVQIKYSIKPDKEILYILCGQFTTQVKEDNNEWIHFTTIKSIDYEQWIGPNGLTYCENSKEIPYKKTDLSAELKSKLNSIEKIKK